MIQSTVPPPFFFPTLYAILYVAGGFLIGLALPLYRRRIPRNPVYGVRFAATLADDRVWYPINARGGRDLVIIGAVFIASVTATLVYGAQWPPLLRIVGPLALLVVALIIDTIVLWRAATQLRQQTAAITERLPNER